MVGILKLLHICERVIDKLQSTPPPFPMGLGVNENYFHRESVCEQIPM